MDELCDSARTDPYAGQPLDQSVHPRRRCDRRIAFNRIRIRVPMAQREEGLDSDGAMLPCPQNRPVCGSRPCVVSLSSAATR